MKYTTISAILFFLFVCSASSVARGININVDAVQGAVVYLYGATQDGQVDARFPVGTAFLVEIPTKSDPGRAYKVLVTARHIVDHEWAKCLVPTPPSPVFTNTPQIPVLAQDKNPQLLYARLNKNNKPITPDEIGVDFVRVQLIETGNTIWQHHQNSDVDIAVIPISNPGALQKFDTSTISIFDFPDDKEIDQFNIGDAVVSAGLLPQIPGVFRNSPIFKFGNISSIPKETTLTRCNANSSLFPVNVWLVAINLVPGNSGSPIFFVPPGGNGISFGGRATLAGVQSISVDGADIAGLTPVKFLYEILEKMTLPDADLHRGRVPTAQ